MRLTIVVPAHNEEQRIGPMMEAYLPYFERRYGADFECLVVVNGSTDGTERQVAGYAARHPALRMLVEPARIGKGGAVILGFRAARGDLIGFVDADGSTPPEAFQALVERLGEAGGIIASRWRRDSQVSPRQPLDRRLASRAFNGLVRLLFGLRLSDTQCGAKLFRRATVEAILPHIGITQWAFDVDLLFQARRAGFRIEEISTIWRDVAGSKLQVGKASTEMVLALARLRLIYSPFRWVVGLYDRFVGPWIHPGGEARDHLITHSLMLFFGAQIGNACNMLFQVVMMRPTLMSPADYGVLSVVLNLLMGLGMPLGALAGTVTHYAALRLAAGDRAGVKALMLGFLRDLLFPAALLAGVALAGQGPLMAFLKLDSPAPLYVAAVAAVVALLATVPNGVLMGVQAFEWAAMLGNSWSVFRLALGTGLVLAGFGVLGALGAHVAGLVLGSLAALAISVSILGRGWVAPRRPAGAYAYMGGYLATFAAYGVLSSADVILVKHYFDAHTAGLFAKAAMVARIVFYLPGPVAAAMFPKVASTGEMSAASLHTLRKALVLATVISLAGVAVCVGAPRVLLTLLAGGGNEGQVQQLRGMVLALTPLTLVQLIAVFELAQRRFAVVIPLGLCAAGYGLGAARWHETPQQIVTVLGVASLVALAGCLGLAWRGARRAGGNR
jgi:glycosyltransferase involved in cell wall biosynthesis/O-antigen/teichoic acid export membrane protein